MELNDRLAKLRADPRVLAILNSKVDIKGSVFDGVDVVPGGTKATEVPAGLRPGVGKFGPIADRLQIITPWTIELPWTTNVVIGDIIVSETENATYQVRAVQDQDHSLGLFVVVLTDRIT